MATERILSADSHVRITDPAVLGHLPAQYHEDYQKARMEYFARMARKAKPKPGKEQKTPEEMWKEQPWEAANRPGEYDPVARIQDMDIDRVKAEVLYTDVECGVGYYAMGDGGRLAAFQAFNNAALEFANHDPKRLLSVYILPLVDVQEAVGEIERLAKAGARAVMLPLYPTDLDLPPYFDRIYDPLWAAISEAGIPISQHVGASGALWNIFGYDTTPARGIFQSLPPIFMAEVIGNWIVGGVFERFPKLNVVLVEAGLGWIPYYLERLDTMQRSHHWDHYGEMIKEKPSHYWHQNMMCTFEEDTLGIELRHKLGLDNMMWATDYPHPDSTWPNSQKVLETHFKDVPVEEVRQIIGGNCARIYRL